MSCSVDILRHDDAVEFLEYVKPDIQRLKSFDFEDLKVQVADRLVQVWVIAEKLEGGGRYLATVLTELIDGGDTCVVHVVGSEMKKWKHLLAEIESWAANIEGATRMEIRGRKGWERIYPDYTFEHVILSKEIHHG